MEYILPLALIICIILVYRKIKAGNSTMYVCSSGKKHKMKLYTPRLGDEITFWVETSASYIIQYNGTVIRTVDLPNRHPLNGAFIVRSKSHQYPYPSNNRPASKLYTIRAHQVVAVHAPNKTPTPVAVANIIEKLVKL